MLLIKEKNMKYFIITLILFSIITTPIFAQLTPDDLLDIQKIIKESETQMKDEIKESETQMKDEINASETRMKEYVDIKFKSVDDRITLVTNLVYALIALIVLGIGIPQIILTRKNSVKSEQERINQELKAEIITLTQKIETLENALRTYSTTLDS